MYRGSDDARSVWGTAQRLPVSNRAAVRTVVADALWPPQVVSSRLTASL
jgi:hypothetical protein